MTYVSYADLGGVPGFGPMIIEPEGDVFHTEWEARVLALTLAMGATGSWNLDQARAARETLANYRTLSYYGIWLTALERLLEEANLLTVEEIRTGRALQPPRPLSRVLQAGDVAAALQAGSPVLRSITRPPHFRVGQRVRAKAGRAMHHTRLPGYVRGRVGVVERIHGVHVFADSRAMGLGEDPQWLYGIVFDVSAPSTEGDHQTTSEHGRSNANHGFSVSIDAWEPYLEAV